MTCPVLNLKVYISKSKILNIKTRGGVEDRRLEAKARTQKKSEAKDKDSLFEDKPSRGQGQKCLRPRPKTKYTGASILRKIKKVFEKVFQAISNSIGVPKIFDWGKPKPQITCNYVIKVFQRGSFCGIKIS